MLQTYVHLGRQKLKYSGARAAALHALEDDAANDRTTADETTIKLIEKSHILKECEGRQGLLNVKVAEQRRAS